MKTVIFINGYPRAGKDSAVGAMSQILLANGMPSMVFSSIDPVRALLSQAGFRLDGKTEADRALLAEVGDAVERHSRYRSRLCVDRVDEFFRSHNSESSAVAFLHVREKEVIDRIAGQLPPFYRILRILVRSHREERSTSNAADSGVLRTRYNATIINDGTLDDLARECDRILAFLDVTPKLTLAH